MEVMPSMRLEVASVLITDPPFTLTGGSSNGWASSGTDSQFFEHWWRSVAVLLSEKLAPHGSGFIWCDWRTVALIEKGFVSRQSRERNWRVAQMLFHDRDMVGLGTPFRNSVDMIAYLRGPEHKVTGLGTNTRNLFQERWYYGTHPHHPAEKSVSVVERLINWADPATADVIIGPFMGSGTTLVAAKRKGISVIGIEREEEYCEMAAKRLQQLSLSEIHQF